MRFKVNSTGMVLETSQDSVLYSRISMHPNEYEIFPEVTLDEPIAICEKKISKKVKKEVI